MDGHVRLNVSGGEEQQGHLSDTQKHGARDVASDAHDHLVVRARIQPAPELALWRTVPPSIAVCSGQFCSAMYSVCVPATPPRVNVRGTVSLGATFGTTTLN